MPPERSLTTEATVLCVDDDAELVETIAAFLEHRQPTFCAVTATSAAEAREVLAERDVESIVCDYRMPEETGLSLLRDVREQDSDVPFILYTAMGSESVASEAIAAGVTDYLQKRPNRAQFELLENRLVRWISEYRATRERELTLERMTDAIIELDDEWRFTVVDDRAAEFYGVDPDELRGETIWEAYPETVETEFYDASHAVKETGEPTSIEEYYRDLGGWFSVDIYPGVSGGVSVYFRDISDQKRRERRQQAITGTLEELLRATDRAEACTVVLDRAVPDLPLAELAIALVDEDRSSLEVQTATQGARRDVAESYILSTDGPAWDAVIEDDVIVVDLEESTGSETDLSQYVVSPLGSHGVVLVGLEEPVDSRTGVDDSIHQVVNGLRVTLDRIEKEDELQQRDRRLEEQNRVLERLTRINELIRNIDQRLIDSKTRSSVFRTICEELGASEPYCYVWIGTYDSTANEVVPRASAGVGNGYLDAIDLSVADDTATGGPIGRVIETHEPQTVSDIYGGHSLTGWEKAAFRWGFRSSISVPIVYRTRLYGILTAYVARQREFDDLETEILTELGETTGNAINAIDRKRALLSDKVVELELRLDPASIELLEPILESNGEITLEHVVPFDEEHYRVFVTVTGCAEEQLSAFAAQSPRIEQSTHVSTQGDRTLYEWVVTEESFLGWLLDYGAVPTSLTVQQDDCRAVVEAPVEEDVGEFVSNLDDVYPVDELLARRDTERSVRTRQEVQAAVEERLTSRQQEVLRTSFFNGYFESPRDRTGSEIADSLGISQATFNTHLRTALRKVIGMLYDADADA